jgi:hypothetical protein
MNDDNDFFGDVFDDPEDDPLLEGEASSTDDPSETSDQPGPPSWMSGSPHPNGEAHADDREEAGANQKRIVVDQQGSGGEGIDALNRAVGQGWRLVRISLARPDGEQAATARDAHRFVATLEQERPQSLFDFGAA